MHKQRDLFESILCKFIINLPEEQIRDESRLSYQIQKSFYYYIDEVLKERQPKDLQKSRNQYFVKLKKYSSFVIKFDLQHIATKLQENKPVCGAIIFNKQNTKVLVIQVRNKFGFPKGKWNQHQTAQDAASRQVKQQTGIYIHHRLDPKIHIQFQSHGSQTHFFVARGVGQQQRITKDHKEIDGVFWMWIQDIRSKIFQFVQKSRMAWNHYEAIIATNDTIDKNQPKKSMNLDQFVEKYCKKPENEAIRAHDQTNNPFLNFKLDYEKLRHSINFDSILDMKI